MGHHRCHTEYAHSSRPNCNGGTLGCSSSNRNLLDFNGFDVDSQGRGVAGVTEGCLNCTNTSPASDSTSAQAMVARQSGGPRLFSHFDPVEPSAPANPQGISAVKATGGVLVSWLEPDNGGSPIVAYNIFRGTSTGTETFLATVSNSPTNTHTKYLDTTATGPTYFYHVTAVNAQGESGFCQELSLGGSSGGCPLGTGSPCAAPYVTVDCAGGPGTVPSDPTSGELTIQNVSIGEPFTSCGDNSLTFVMSVQTLDPLATGTPVLPANSEWQIVFGITDTNGNPQTLYIDLNTIAPITPATPGVDIGRRDPSATGGTFDTSGGCTVNGVPCSITATTTTSGLITFKLDVSGPLNFAAPNAAATGVPFVWDASKPGVQMGAITGNTYLFVGAGAGLLETIQTTGAFGSYTRVGNVSCSDNPPVAVLSANPLSGNPPLTVNFDASGSNEPAGSCGSINSYTLDFGDGSAAVTQTTPTFTHIYGSVGDFPARLTVGDSAGQTSSNPAEAVITVSPAATPTPTPVPTATPTPTTTPTPTPTATPPSIQVVVQTSVAGPTFTVDGANYSSTQTFSGCRVPGARFPPQRHLKAVAPELRTYGATGVMEALSPTMLLRPLTPLTPPSLPLNIS